MPGTIDQLIMQTPAFQMEQTVAERQRPGPADERIHGVGVPAIC